MVVALSTDDIFSTFRYRIVNPRLTDLPPFSTPFGFTLISVVLIVKMLAEGVLASSGLAGTGRHLSAAAIKNR